MTAILDGQLPTDDAFVATLRGDLLRWLRDEGQPTDGVEVLAAVPLLTSGDAPEYGVVLYRDAGGEVRLWTAWQYSHPWNAARALEVLEARAAAYERASRWTKAFVALARAEGAR